VLSSRALDGHQTYFGGSAVGKASTIGIETSPIPPLIFTKGQKVRSLASLSTSLNFEPPAFENATRYPNSETKMQCCDDCPIFLPSLVKWDPRAPENRLSVVLKPQKLHVLYRQKLSGEFSTSLKFCTKFKRMTPEVL